MRITESTLRRIVREEIVNENVKSGRMSLREGRRILREEAGDTGAPYLKSQVKMGLIDDELLDKVSTKDEYGKKNAPDVQKYLSKVSGDVYVIISPNDGEASLFSEDPMFAEDIKALKRVDVPYGFETGYRALLAATGDPQSKANADKFIENAKLAYNKLLKKQKKD